MKKQILQGGGIKKMCDYSLAGISNRLAVEGEELVIYRFHTGSIGLASPCASPSRWWSGKQTPAVCVPPGARLTLLDVPKRLQHDLAVGPIEEVTFVQLSAKPYQFRDAVRFSNGREVRLQELNEGMRVRVLKMSLPEDSSFESVREERKGVFVD
jgi:hypothetical protein